jgi:hypothetical protein
VPSVRQRGGCAAVVGDPGNVARGLFEFTTQPSAVPPRMGCRHFTRGSPRRRRHEPRLRRRRRGPRCTPSSGTAAG